MQRTVLGEEEDEVAHTLDYALPSKALQRARDRATRWRHFRASKIVSVHTYTSGDGFDATLFVCVCVCKCVSVGARACICL
uniref:Uncharacterized protein n=1 Tax=Ascaris lumbricoides TaxID=6252 RepID=A0A0M3IF38_ASCLU